MEEEDRGARSFEHMQTCFPPSRTLSDWSDVNTYASNTRQHARGESWRRLAQCWRLFCALFVLGCARFESPLRCCVTVCPAVRPVNCWACSVRPFPRFYTSSPVSDRHVLIPFCSLSASSSWLLCFSLSRPGLVSSSRLTATKALRSAHSPTNRFLSISSRIGLPARRFAFKLFLSSVLPLLFS